MPKRTLPSYIPSTSRDRKARVKEIEDDEEANNAKEEYEADNISFDSNYVCPVDWEKDCAKLDSYSEMFESNTGICKSEDERNILRIFQAEYLEFYSKYHSLVVASGEDDNEYYYGRDDEFNNSVDDQSNADSDESDCADKTHQEIDDAINAAQNVVADFRHWMNSINHN
jgi:hypothetical protein